MTVYSLTDYLVIVELPKSFSNYLVDKKIILGGPQSYLESISIRHNEETFSVKGDHTGSYVHTFNANRTGEIELSLNQISNSSKLLTKLFSIYFNKKDRDGTYVMFDSIPKITVKNERTGKVVAEAKDSYLKRNTEKKYGNEAENESWVFVSGEISFF